MKPGKIFQKMCVGKRSPEGTNTAPADLDARTSVNDLAAELLEMIFEELPQSNLTSISRTCRRFHDISTPVLYRTFRPRAPHTKQMAQLSDTLSYNRELSQYFRYLDVSSAHWSVSEERGARMTWMDLVERDVRLGVPRSRAIRRVLPFHKSLSEEATQDYQLVMLLLAMRNLREINLLMRYPSSMTYMRQPHLDVAQIWRATATWMRLRSRTSSQILLIHLGCCRERLWVMAFGEHALWMSIGGGYGLGFTA